MIKLLRTCPSAPAHRESPTAHSPPGANIPSPSSPFCSGHLQGWDLWWAGSPAGVERNDAFWIGAARAKHQTSCIKPLIFLIYIRFFVFFWFLMALCEMMHFGSELLTPNIGLPACNFFLFFVRKYILNFIHRLHQDKYLLFLIKRYLIGIKTKNFWRFFKIVRAS